MKNIILITFVFVVILADSLVCFGRPLVYMPYDKLNNEADLVVIATPVSVRDTGEKASLLVAVPARGVETAFEVLTVLKGDKDLKRFLFYHWRQERPDEEIDGPNLIAFHPREKKRYLLFLKREKDGRYSSMTGQTDPIYGIRDLGTFP